MKCKKHPTYQAKRYPVSECPVCLKMYQGSNMKKKIVKRKVKRKIKSARPAGKRWFYWITDAECEKFYFDSPSKFLGFLQNNDPIECGAERMSKKEFDALPDYE